MRRKYHEKSGTGQIYKGQVLGRRSSPQYLLLASKNRKGLGCQFCLTAKVGMAVHLATPDEHISRVLVDIIKYECVFTSNRKQTLWAVFG